MSFEDVEALTGLEVPNAHAAIALMTAGCDDALSTGAELQSADETGMARQNAQSFTRPGVSLELDLLANPESA